jgi:hypothetical protein
VKEKEQFNGLKKGVISITVRKRTQTVPKRRKGKSRIGRWGQPREAGKNNSIMTEEATVVV